MPPESASNVAMDQITNLEDLPAPVFTIIIEHLVVIIGIEKSVRLRSVSRSFNAAIMYTLCVSQVVDMNDPATPHLAMRIPPPLKGEILLTKSRSPKATEDKYLPKCLAAIANVNEALDRLTQPTGERRNAGTNNIGLLPRPPRVCTHTAETQFGGMRLQARRRKCRIS